MTAATSPARSRANVRREIESALTDEATAGLPDRQIAKIVGCSHPTVAAVRREFYHPSPSLVRKPKTFQIPADPHKIVNVPIGMIKPSPENETLYRPVHPSDPEIRALADSLESHGQREPIVLTLDGYIVSGHRRHCAATLAGFTTIKVRVEQYKRGDDIGHHIVMLCEFNRQRDKSNAEKLREEIVSVDPEEAYCSLIEHRRESAKINSTAMVIGEGRGRSAISEAKKEFADRIVEIVRTNERFWPLTDRRIHYLILNDPPLRNADKPGSRYRNDERSYKDLTNMLTRLRLTVGGQKPRIPMHAIGDETRPVTRWDVHPDPRAFVRKQIDGFLKGYWRDLMVSQPNHIEIVAEKNTVKPIVEEIAARYTIPVTTGRGYSSLPPRHAMATRFHNNGKERLIVLAVSDADPEGMDIATSFGRSMRDDFGIDSIEVIKVALTPQQARDLKLPEDTMAKLSSSRAAKYVKQYGEHVWELEALPPEMLQKMLTDSIDSVIDVGGFNAAIDDEKRDAHWLEGVRRGAIESLRSSVGDTPDL